MIDKARSGARSEALQCFKLKCWDADRGGDAIVSERKCHGWRRIRSSENEVVGRRGASGDGAHLVGGGRDLRRQLLTQLELLGDNPPDKRRFANNYEQTILYLLVVGTHRVSKLLGV